MRVLVLLLLHALLTSALLAASGYWTPVGPVDGQLHLARLSADDTRPDTMYALADSLWGTDDGVSWHVIPAPVTFGGGNGFLVALHVAPSDGSLYEIGQAGLGSALFHSTDRGGTWTKALGPEGGMVDEFTVDPTDSNVVYIALYYCLGTTCAGVMKSVDAGQHWSKSFFSGSQVYWVIHDPHESGIVYAKNDEGWWITKNGGASWTPIFKNIDLMLGSDFLAIDPYNGTAVYVLDDLHGVLWRSLDRGEHTERLALPFRLDPLAGGRLAFDRNSGAMVIAAGGDSVYRSLDHGLTWTALGAPGVLDLTVDGRGRIYVSNWSGLYEFIPVVPGRRRSVQR